MMYVVVSFKEGDGVGAVKAMSDIKKAKAMRDRFDNMFFKSSGSTAIIAEYKIDFSYDKEKRTLDTELSFSKFIGEE